MHTPNKNKKPCEAVKDVNLVDTKVTEVPAPPVEKMYTETEYLGCVKRLCYRFNVAQSSVHARIHEFDNVTESHVTFEVIKHPYSWDRFLALCSGVRTFAVSLLGVFAIATLCALYLATFLDNANTIQTTEDQTAITITGELPQV